MNLIGRADLAKKYASHDDRVEARAQEEIYPAIEEFLKDKNKEEAATHLYRRRHHLPAPAHLSGKRPTATTSWRGTPWVGMTTRTTATSSPRKPCIR